MAENEKQGHYTWLIRKTWIIGHIDHFPSFSQIHIVHSTTVFVEPILENKTIANNDKLRKLSLLTFALNTIVLESIEKEPGSSVRSCFVLLVIIGVTN
jgi:hypothetical protein